MSDLDFFDVFRQFLGEIQKRGYPMEQRQQLLTETISTLKSLLSQQYQFSGMGNALQQPVQQYQPTLSSTMQVQQQSPRHQQPPSQPVQVPTQDLGLGGGVVNPRKAVIQKISTICYNAGSSLRNVFLQFEGAKSGGCTIAQLESSLKKIGCTFLQPGELEQLITPFLTEKGRIDNSALVRFFNSAGE